MTWQWHGHAVTGDGVRIVYTVHEPTDDSRSSGALCKDAQAPPRLPILVCRGWGMVKEDSAGLARAISTAWDRPVIVVDNRGSGESVIGLEASVDMETIADDCAAVAHAVTDHRRALTCATNANTKSLTRIHVFGVSMGGFVAQLLALRHPDIVVSLALGCSHYGGPNHVPTSKEYVSMINAEPPREPKDRWLVFMRRSLAMNFAPGFVTSHPERFEKMFHDFVHVELTRAKGGKEAQLKGIRRFLKIGTQHQLHRIKAPVFILHGDSDQITPVRNAWLLASELPNVDKVCVLEGLGHMLWDENVELVARLLGEFAARYDHVAVTAARL